MLDKTQICFLIDQFLHSSDQELMLSFIQHLFHIHQQVLFVVPVVVAVVETLVLDLVVLVVVQVVVVLQHQLRLLVVL